MRPAPSEKELKMETNESILVRNVVGLDDRRVIGKMRELRVDCDTLAVSHYIVASATTTATQPKKPSDSPTKVKMKSLYISGT